MNAEIVKLPDTATEPEVSPKSRPQKRNKNVKNLRKPNK